MSRKKPANLKILSLCTAEQGCSLAMVNGSSLLYEEFWATKLTHSRTLVKMIGYVLKNLAGLRFDDIDGFVVARGPGNFTGLRIGISVIMGLSYAVNKPVAGVSSLDGIAFRFACSSIPVCVMMDAKRNEVYCSVYYFKNGSLISKSPEIIDSPEKAVELTKGEPVLFAGSGSKVYKDIIQQKAKHSIFAQGFSDNASAAALVHSLYLSDNYFPETGAELVPIYIRKSDAEMMI